MIPNFSFALPVKPFWKFDVEATDKRFQPIFSFCLDDALSLRKVNVNYFPLVEKFIYIWSV